MLIPMKPCWIISDYVTALAALKRGVVKEIAARPTDYPEIEVPKALAWFETQTGFALGDEQREAGNHNRFAVEASAMTIEVVAQVAHRGVELVGRAAHHMVGLCQRSEQCALGLDRRLALPSQVDLPSALMQERAGDPVDQLCIDRC